MAVGLPGPAEKAAAVRAMFDRIAARYDRLNVVMTCGLDASWRRAAVLAAALRPGDVVIDLACGTAKLARLAAAAGARAVGVDFAAGMLRAARRSGVRLPLVQADAFTLPLRGGVAAAVTCGFALRNFAAIRPVLAEAGRVLRPGGRLVLLEVATPRNPVLRSMHHVYFHRVMPVLGALLAERAAYDYLPRSTVYLPDPPALRVLLEASGFAGVAIRPLAAGAVQLVTATRDGGR
jgi:demethylmenaquinone methyltransferase/2-methoxy-6-polyprenyl-1,4-benzoquinol methylase